METNRENIVPFKATHPTTILREELEARGISEKEFAEKIGMTSLDFNHFMKYGDITIPIALKLEDALNIPAEDWVKMQILYERDRKKIALREAKKKIVELTSTEVSTLV